MLELTPVTEVNDLRARYLKGLKNTRRKKQEITPDYLDIHCIQDVILYLGVNTKLIGTVIIDDATIIEKAFAFSKKYFPDRFTIDEIEELVQDELEHIKNYLENYKGKGENEEKKSDEQIQSDKKIHDTALDILKKGNPLDYIIEKYNKIHVGDTVLGKILICTFASTTILNSAGLHPGLTGTSGKGKSNACISMHYLLPEEWKYYGSSSDKGVLYRGFEPGTVIFLDDIGTLSDGLESIIKRSTSTFQEGFTHIIPNLKKKGPKKYDEISFPPRCTWWITSHDGSFDMQVLNRQIMLNIDDNTSQDEAVFKHQVEKAMTGTSDRMIDEEVLICQEIFRILKKDNINVAIPFADKLEWKNKDNRRNFEMFLDIIRSFTALFRYQREVENGCVIADKKDYENAKNVWTDGCAKEQMSKLTKNEMIIFQKIIQHNDYGLSLNDIIRESSFSQGYVHELLHGKRNLDGTHRGGLLQKIPGLISEDVYNESTKRNLKKYRYVGIPMDIWDQYKDVVSITS